MLNLAVINNFTPSLLILNPVFVTVDEPRTDQQWFYYEILQDPLKILTVAHWLKR